MSKKLKTAVYIGRFQFPHNGHLKTIKKALEISEKVLIFIGSYNRPPTIKNPFDVETRVKLLKESIAEYMGIDLIKPWSDTPEKTDLDRIKFLFIRDYWYNDYKWLSEVYAKALLNGAEEGKETCLIGCPKDDSSYYLKMFPKWTFISVPYFWSLDSSDLREEFFKTGDITNDKCPNYLKSYCLSNAGKEILDPLKEEYDYYESEKKKWGKAPYKPTFITVDTLIIKSGCILLIKRKFPPGKNLWAMPGGFLDTGENIKDGALREVKEETSIAVHKDDLRDKIQEFKTFDHPKRSLRGRVITFAFLIDLGFGPLPKVKAKSDAKGAFWIPLADIPGMESQMFEDHFDIIFNLTSKY